MLTQMGLLKPKWPKIEASGDGKKAANPDIFSLGGMPLSL